MLLLDTNVVSEIMRAHPDAHVTRWLAAQPLAETAVATITIMEIRFGIALLPRGRRRTELGTRFGELLSQAFADRVLAFDSQAADACTEIRARRRQMGRPITVEDGMMAAIARVHGASVVTRDVAGFEACGVALINPWAG